MMPRPFAFSKRMREIIERFALVVCPPALVTSHLMGSLMREVEFYLGAMSPLIRRVLLASFGGFDQAARLWRPGRGRHFVELPGAAAELYFRHRAASSSATSRSLLKLMKGIVIMCYYDLPEVGEQLGYHPREHIADVTLRRLERYGNAIRDGEEAVFTDPPSGPR